MSEIALTGTNQTEQAVFQYETEVLTQEQLVANPQQGVWQMLPGRDPGTFLVVKRKFCCWQTIGNTANTHHNKLATNDVGIETSVMLAGLFGASLGAVLGRK